MLLGFNTVRNAIVSIAIIEAFSVKKNIKGFDIKQFWTHSVAVAITSQYLAAESKLCNSSDAFTAGLLHDIGKIVLLRYFNDLFVDPQRWALLGEIMLRLYVRNPVVTYLNNGFLERLAVELYSVSFRFYSTLFKYISEISGCSSECEIAKKFWCKRVSSKKKDTLFGDPRHN